MSLWDQLTIWLSTLMSSYSGSVNLYACTVSTFWQYWWGKVPCRSLRIQPISFCPRFFLFLILYFICFLVIICFVVLNVKCCFFYSQPCVFDSSLFFFVILFWFRVQKIIFHHFSRSILCVCLLSWCACVWFIVTRIQCLCYLILTFNRHSKS